MAPKVVARRALQHVTCAALSPTRHECPAVRAADDNDALDAAVQAGGQCWGCTTVPSKRSEARKSGVGRHRGRSSRAHHQQPARRKRWRVPSCSPMASSVQRCCADTRPPRRSSSRGAVGWSSPAHAPVDQVLAMVAPVAQHLGGVSSQGRWACVGVHVRVRAHTRVRNDPRAAMRGAPE